MVDETQLEYTLPTIDSFNSGCLIAHIEPKPKKLAVLCELDGWNDAKFVETIAVNRDVSLQGFKKIR